MMVERSAGECIGRVFHPHAVPDLVHDDEIGLRRQHKRLGHAQSGNGTFQNGETVSEQAALPYAKAYVMGAMTATAGPSGR